MRLRIPRLTSRTATSAGLATTCGTILLCGAVACGPVRPERQAAPVVLTTRESVAARDHWAADIDTLRTRVSQLTDALTALDASFDDAHILLAQERFDAARTALKRIEALGSYYEPSTLRAINGPALPRVDDDEGPEAVFAPEGFQVLEEQLFPVPERNAVKAAIDESRNLGAYVTRLHTAAARQQITDDRLWDAARLEVARIVTLGITGFDSPVALHSLSEASAAVAGLRGVLSAYEARLGQPAWMRLDAAFAVALDRLAHAPSFEQFDRLDFITAAANPLAREMHDARRALGIGVPTELRAFRMNAVTIFDRDAFDAQAFAAPQAERSTPERVELGRLLFAESRLSGSGTTTCIQCHDPSIAFTDRRTRSASRSGRAVLRNAPSVINAGLQVGAFYDLRATYLEDQVTDVVRNAEEMHGSVDRAAGVLAQDSAYRRRFAAAFLAANPAVSGRNIQSAIASYIRSLEALDSRADRALRGDTSALTREERRGLNLFMGKARCATCHFAPLFNGTSPPMYQETDVEVLGVPREAITRGARIDPDSGRFRVTRSAPHLFAFRTPSVRNAALTAPYMHNGVYRTLDEVVDFYDRGGGAGIGITLGNQTLPTDPLHLDAAERRAIVRFIGALTDTSYLGHRPTAARR
ncbi:MAG: cytochrome-c peroxidase [Gemmatimonadaceae bacterium]|nr:cytochrome-c peroxidase [Gemmatimonadaceae bacterium]